MLQKPTLFQNALFASYVSVAHSWYKHLPIYRKVPFYFFLGPHAGKNVVYDQNSGVMFIREVTDDSDKFHYTWQTTKDYLRRFGHWSYKTEYGTSFVLFKSDLKVGISTREKMADISDNPLDSKKEGVVYLSAFIYPGWLWSFWMKRIYFGDLDIEKVFPTLPDQIPVGLRNLWSLLLLLQAENSDRYQSVLSDTEYVSAVNELKQKGEINFPDYYLWKNDELIYKYCEKLFGIENILKIIFALEFLRTQSAFSNVIKEHYRIEPDQYKN